MPILIMGDVHGSWQKLIDAVAHGVARHGATSVIQVGDFGFESNQFPALETTLAVNPFSVPVHAIDGALTKTSVIHISQAELVL